MKRLMTLLAAMALMSAALWADETITVSANSSDISQSLDLKVVANLFAESKNLEEFESKLNDPNEFYNNLDLNGDGDVDYIRVVEVGEGSKRLIILQAILAKDIYQDIATIYVEKDASDQVSMQIIGDEYIYGTNYIIEPVYIYRPLIYDWFWSPAWYAWTSPWYWGYYPSWWFFHHCLAWDVYWHHCYAYHHHHHHCSFHYGREPHHGYREMYGRHGARVSHREYASQHPERSFSQRTGGAHNARTIQSGGSARSRQADAMSSQRSDFSRQGYSQGATSSRTSMHGDRTFGSRNTVSARGGQATTAQRSGQTATSQRGSQTVTTQRSGQTATTQRSGQTATTQRSGQATVTRQTGTSSSYRAPGSSTATRSSGSSSSGYTTTTRSSSSSSSSSRSSSTYSGGSRSSSSSSYSGSSRSSGGYSGSSSRSSGGYSGGSSRGGGGYSGGHSSGGSSRGGGGSHRR